MDDFIRDVSQAAPVSYEEFALASDRRRTGLVIVDEVNGFAAVGYGNLAPPLENPQVSRMVAETDRLARSFSENGRPIFAFLDTHERGKPAAAL